MTAVLGVGITAAVVVVTERLGRRRPMVPSVSARSQRSRLTALRVRLRRSATPARWVMMWRTVATVSATVRLSEVATTPTNVPDSGHSRRPFGIRRGVAVPVGPVVPPEWKRGVLDPATAGFGQGYPGIHQLALLLLRSQVTPRDMRPSVAADLHSRASERAKVVRIQTRES